MRQAGVLAAAALVALDEMVDRLAEDHANAHALAEGLAGLPGLRVDLSTVATNMVIFRVEEGLVPAQLVDGVKQEGVLVLSMGGNRLRAVTHRGVTAEDCARAVQVFARVLEHLGASDAVRAQSMPDALYGRR
jgi:threonine aldolase